MVPGRAFSQQPVHCYRGYLIYLSGSPDGGFEYTHGGDPPDKRRGWACDIDTAEREIDALVDGEKEAEYWCEVCEAPAVDIDYFETCDGKVGHATCLDCGYSRLTPISKGDDW